jgi:hypothetical protein
MALGNDYRIDTDRVERGAAVAVEGKTLAYAAFIDATGQHSMSADDIPFPSLQEQGVVRKAQTVEAQSVFDEGSPDVTVETGGIELDDAFRPIFQHNLSNKLYCAAISFLLHKLPFVQGITSAEEIGGIVSKAIVDDVTANNRLQLIK